MHIDWAHLSNKLGCESSGGTQYARQALSKIIGDDAIIEAVEYYISGHQGAELARSVLWHIHPEIGMDYCYKIFKEDPDIERRRIAVELLRVVADKKALGWADDFLNDPDSDIQAWGAGLVDQLLWSELVEEEDCATLLITIKKHENLQVRERYDFISGFLAGRKGNSEQAGDDQPPTGLDSKSHDN